MLPAPFSTISTPTMPDSIRFTNLGAISLDLDSLDSLIHARLFRASVLSFIIARMAPMTLTTAFFCSWAQVGMLRSTSSRTGLGPISSNHVPSWSFIVTCCLTPSCPIHDHPCAQHCLMLRMNAMPRLSVLPSLMGFYLKRPWTQGAHIDWACIYTYCTVDRSRNIILTSSDTGP